MPPPPFIDLSSIDLSRVIATREDVYKVLPQRYEFEALDGVLHIDTERMVLVAYRDIRADDWWCRGHLPGRPIFPGILMVEAAAQLASYYDRLAQKSTKFLAFGGIDNVKFRGAVIPPARMIFVGRALEIRSRRTSIEVHGFVDDRMVFEGHFTGMPID